jgi:hypothetical protein
VRGGAEAVTKMPLTHSPGSAAIGTEWPGCRSRPFFCA